MDARDPGVDLQRGGRASLSLDAGHVAELLAEVAPLVEGRIVTRCVPLPPRDLLLLLDPGASTSPAPDAGRRARPSRLRLSAEPDLPRFFLESAREERPRGPLGPFFRQVEQDLAGARLARLSQPGRDRVLLLEFSATPESEPRALVLELFGRRANLVLCSGGERVITSLVPSAPAEGPSRLQPGAPWRPPGGPQRDPPSGPALAASLGPPPEPPQGVVPDPRAPLSWLVESRLGAELAALSRARAARDLAARLQRKLARAQALVRGLEQRAAAAGAAERVRQDGELLKLHVSALARGTRELEVADVFEPDAPPRKLILDPRRSPRENVQLFFDRYRKLARAQGAVAGELALARARLDGLQALLGELEAENSDPDELERRALSEGLLDQRQEPDRRKRKQPEPRRPYRIFTGLRGGEIRVGRTARDNDQLTLRHCRGNDLWLHTADAPGSHVVLRLERDAEPDPEELLDAAHLAVHFSPLRAASRAAVHVARRKQVHKPRGAKPGLVTLSGGRILQVRMQPQRLQRLLGRQGRGPDSDPA